VNYEKDNALKSLLDDVYYSPREQTYIRVYLEEIQPATTLTETFEYLGRVAAPEDAIYNAAQLELLYILHVQDSPIRDFIPLEGQLAAVNKRGELILIVPWDIVQDNADTRKLLAEVVRISRQRKCTSTQLWFTGDVELSYYNLAKKYNVTVRQNLLKDPLFQKDTAPDEPAIKK
jgi:hypothetical protein